VKHREQVIGNTVFIRQDCERARGVLREDGTDAVSDRRGNRRDLVGYLNDLLVILAMNCDDIHHFPPRDSRSRPAPIRAFQNRAEKATIIGVSQRQTQRLVERDPAKLRMLAVC